jgi:hypothetical protein
MKIISRDEAVQLGLSRYFTGKPCSKGHIAYRRTANHNCSVCSNEQAKARSQKLRDNSKLTVTGNPKHEQPAREKARQEAIRSGAKTYFHGIPCKRGHVAPRHTSNGMCMDCSRQQNSTDKAKARKKKHKLDNAEHYREMGRQYRAENSDKMREYLKQYYADNKEEHLKKNRLYRIKHRDCPEQKAKKKAFSDKWRKENPDYFTEYAIKRSKVLKKATPSWANISSITVKYKERTAMTRLTGIQHHVDHIIPLQGKNVCGLHVPANLRVIPARDNLRKHNRFE